MAILFIWALHPVPIHADAPPTIFVVNSTSDNRDKLVGDNLCLDFEDKCTLRAAIMESNFDSAPNIINFDIPVTDPMHFCYSDDTVTDQVSVLNIQPTTIQNTCSNDSTIDPDYLNSWFSIKPTTRLPTITQPLTIDGATQTGTNLQSIGLTRYHKIEIDMSLVTGKYNDAIEIRANDVHINGLVINNAVSPTYPSDGIGFIFAIGGSVKGCNIGTDISGTIIKSNKRHGIQIDYSSRQIFVGGNQLQDRNIISGNNRSGINLGGISGLFSSNNIIQNNFIGLDSTGKKALRNLSIGIEINGGSRNNIIGTDSDGTFDSSEGNYISGNKLYGVVMNSNNTQDNAFSGNVIGLNYGDNDVVSNGIAGLLLGDGAFNNYIGIRADGFSDEQERNTFSGNNVGIFVRGAGYNLIQGNRIGIKPDGLTPVNVGSFGIQLRNSNGVVIGTNGDGNFDNFEGNQISSIPGVGIYGFNVKNSKISGNYLGTDSSGSTGISSGRGILLSGRIETNIIGTNGDGLSDELEGNLISGMRGIALSIFNNADEGYNRISGNKIGTNQSGSLAIRNSLDGINTLSNYDTIGSNRDGVSDLLEGNLLSGNNSAGLVIRGNDNLIASNKIGTDYSGLNAISNNFGLVMYGEHNWIGVGYESPRKNDERNIISGNNFDGINLNDSADGYIIGNYIGVAINGVSALPNGRQGIMLHNNTAGTLIGSNMDENDDEAEGNIIAYNAHNGIQMTITAGSGNGFTGNKLFRNGLLGIDIAWSKSNAPDSNDPGDDDKAGPNDMMNYPVINSITGNTDGEANVFIDVPNGGMYGIQICDNPSGVDDSNHGECEKVIGWRVVTINVNDDIKRFDVPFRGTISVPNNLTAIVSEYYGRHGSTSEISKAFQR